MSGGLPYEYDDSAKMDEDHPMLDRALDDEFAQYASYPATPMTALFGSAPPTTSRDRGVIPEHIANLLGRMSRSKVYLAEESAGIIHHDAEARLARDPRLARLAEELNSQDPTAWLEAISETAPHRIRPTALFVSSELIKHLSTAKVFTWASGVGATAMGIEWLNDSTLVLVFATPAATLLGLSMLAKAGFDPTEGDDPLLERAAHGIPASLLPQVEPAAPRVDADVRIVVTEHDEDGGEQGAAAAAAGDESMDADEAATAAPATASTDGVRRRGRGTFAATGREPTGSARGAFDLEPLAPANPAAGAAGGPVFAAGVDPHARVTVRYATDADHVQRRSARDSEWYARHGRNAGKDVARRNYSAVTGSGPSPLSAGLGGFYGYGRGALDLKDRVGTNGEGRDFARRIGRERERAAPYSPRTGTPREKRSAADLDAELERLAASRAAGDEDVPTDEWQRERERHERAGGSGGGGSRRGGRSGRSRRDPPRGNREDLDRELDEMFAARSSGA